jgi:transposase
LPSWEAKVARQVVADDLRLLACLDAQIVTAEAKLAQLLPDTPFAPLITVPWGTVSAATTAPRSVTLTAGREPVSSTAASGLSPAQYESAGKRRDGNISGEGSVQLRRALIDLGIGLWHADPAARHYGQQLRARGKKGGVIACAMANRANRIAYALVRDQSGYDPDRWA